MEAFLFSQKISSKRNIALKEIYALVRNFIFVKKHLWSFLNDWVEKWKLQALPWVWLDVKFLKFLHKKMVAFGFWNRYLWWAKQPDHMADDVIQWQKIYYLQIVVDVGHIRSVSKSLYESFLCFSYSSLSTEYATQITISWKNKNNFNLV